VPEYKWKPIEPLGDNDRAIDLAAIRPLYDTWQKSRQRLLKSSGASLERLYDLDRGTTEALVAEGFVEDLVARSSTDIEPSHLIDILRDQEAAIQLVMDCVAHKREMSKGAIHELHTILTQHQDTVTAVDQFGHRQEIPLLKGRFKEHPNNPKRPDGSIHEYCPPIHVESEMDRLLGWLEEYSDEDPIIVSAWVHHRFTQIHPYQDGNGRVARALITLLLLRSDLLPLVIDRDLRTEYIRDLESADQGDLAPLASLFARLERTAILQALSVDADAEIAHERTLTSAVIESLAHKLDRRREEKIAELRRVNEVAKALRTSTRKSLEDAFNALAKPVSSVGEPQIHITDGGPDRDNAHWYKYEVIESARGAGKYANFTEEHYFVKASIRVERERLVFVVSFHHVGRDLTGIMEATAFARLQSYEDSDDREFASQDFFLCSLEPFVFTYQTIEQDITDSYSRWLDSAIAVAVKEYGDRL
jgi:fido (protein-threonine AMPylation protein)